MKVNYISWLNFLKRASHKYTELRSIIPGDPVLVPEYLLQDEEIKVFFNDNDIVKEEKNDIFLENVCEGCNRIASRCKCDRIKERSDQLEKFKQIDLNAAKEEKLEEVEDENQIVIDTSKEALKYLEKKEELQKKMIEEGKNKIEIKEEIKKLKKSSTKKMKKCVNCGEFYSSSECLCNSKKEV